MAVKKTAKKAAAKKAVAKKAPAKKVAAKKATVKKAVAKKASAKKAIAKKAPAKKVAAKKATVKKAVAKKAVAKKAPAKRATAKKSVAPEAPTRIVIPAVSTFTPSNAVETAPSVVTIDSKPPAPVSSSAPTTGPTPIEKSSSRVVLWVVVGVILIAILVVARNHKASNVSPTTTPTPVASATSTPSDTSSPTEMTTPSNTPSAEPTPATTPTAAPASDLAPIGIVAHYNATGATIYWYPADKNNAPTTYNVEAASDGGAFKLIATVPTTQLTLNVTETSSDGWTSFKISAVYADGNTVAGKVFGLPGQYN